MFKATIEYGLQGAFKVDTYDRSGNFVETTDWFNNFITQTGLMYPNIYSFANCFRFLTIGRDYATPNYAGDAVSPTAVTTGCYTPITLFYDSDGNAHDGRWIGHQGYETGTLPNNSACLTSLTDNGPVFYRAWSIPTGGAVFGRDYDDQTFMTIGEFAVSPTSGSNPTGRYAFSRIQRQFTLKAGYRAVVSYQLAVRTRNSRLTLMPAGTFDTGNANVDNDTDMLTQWKDLSGYYRQVWCGLSCVDRWGVSFITKFGNGMEPSLSDLSNYFVYLSPDNGQFDVNTLSGGAQLNPNLAWNSDGIMTPLGFSTRPALSLSPDRTSAGLGTAAAQNTLFYGPELESTTIPLGVTPVNIRLGSSNQPIKVPHLRGYTGDITNIETFGAYSDTNFNYQVSDRFVDASQEEISYATPGGSGLDLNREAQYHERAVFSSRIFRLPMDMANTGNSAQRSRKKTITRKAIFAPAASLGYNTRFGSMVFAHKVPLDSDEPNNYTFYPTIDCLFYDTSGRTLLQHYRQISGIYLTSRGSGVLHSRVRITGGAANIARHLNLKTFHGAITTGGFANTGLFGGVSADNFFTSGVMPTTASGKSALSLQSGWSGWGVVWGVTGDYLNPSRALDVGIMDHNTGISGDNATGQLYWPNVFGNPLSVVFSDIIFSGYGSGPNNGPYPDSNASDAVLAASGFARPSGIVFSFDAIGPTGYRLLPNYGVGNVIDILGTGANKYTPTLGYSGGCLPGLSSDNGLEVYLDIIWGSSCGNAQECQEPYLP